jgi:hypothetical protein
MLPMLAMAVAGYMAKQGGAGGGSGLGGALGGMLGNMLGGGKAKSGGLGALLDMDGNGNPLDDILRAAGKLGR